jgi:hypothetical protein
MDKRNIILIVLVIALVITIIAAFAAIRLSQNEMFNAGYKEGSRYPYHYWEPTPYEDLEDFVSQLDYNYWYVTEITPIVVINLNEYEDIILYNVTYYTIPKIELNETIEIWEQNHTGRTKMMTFFDAIGKNQKAFKQNNLYEVFYSDNWRFNSVIHYKLRVG